MNFKINSLNEVDNFIDEFFSLSESELVKLFNLKFVSNFGRNEGVFVLPSGNMISVSEFGEESTHEDFIYSLIEELSEEIEAPLDIINHTIDKLYDEISIDDFIIRFGWCRFRMGYLGGNRADMTLPRKITTNQKYAIEDFINNAYDSGIKQITVIVEVSYDNIDGKSYDFSDMLPDDVMNRINRYFSSGKFYENSQVGKVKLVKENKYYKFSVEVV